MDTVKVGVSRSEMVRWYPMRVTYGREEKIKDALDALDVRNFLPMQRLRGWVDEDGVPHQNIVPAIRNLIFVNASQQRITELKMYNKDCQPLRYMTNPFPHDDNDYLLTVPDRQMENFIKVATVQDDRLLYLDPNADFLRKPGQKVRITDGEFKDAEGVIKRIKNNKRVVVEIQGVAALAITFVPSIWLQPID
jgi:hypothetical protein